MRTTLTLDPDVAALLERVRAARNASLKQIVNEALRLGLVQMNAAGSHRDFETRARSLGPCLVASIDDVSEALALGESESFH